VKAVPFKAGGRENPEAAKAGQPAAKAN
jgi:hypothetical protein